MFIKHRQVIVGSELTMGPRSKLVIGVLLILFGIWWYVPDTVFSAITPFSSLTNLQALVALVQGGAGVLAVLIGIFVVWIELDEIRMRRELEARNFGESVSESVEPGTEDASEPGEEEADSDVYACEECGKEFDTERGLKSHAGQKHK